MYKKDARTQKMLICFDISFISTTFAAMKHQVTATLMGLCLLYACQTPEKKPTYGEIKAKNIDSMIQVAEKDIPQLDSQLQQAIAAYNELNRKVEAHKSELRATESELQQLGLLRLERDSLQVLFDTQCARVRFLHKKLEEVQQKKDKK